MRYLFIPALALLLASCGTPADTNGPASADTTKVAVTPEAPTTAIAIEGTRWELVELNGAAVVIGADLDTIHITLNATDSMANGNAGCNNFFGAYHRQGADGLRFGNLGSTMKACPDMSTEQALHAALPKVDHFKLEEGMLTLLHDNMAVAKWRARK